MVKKSTIGRALNIYLPKNIKLPSPKLIFHRDTSGSVSEGEISAGAREMERIFHQFYNEGGDFTVIDCDSTIQATYKVSKKADIDSLLEYKGGGGTSHLPVFEYFIREKKEILISITDGYSDIEEALKSFTSQLKGKTYRFPRNRS